MLDAVATKAAHVLKILQVFGHNAVPFHFLRSTFNHQSCKLFLVFTTLHQV